MKNEHDQWHLYSWYCANCGHLVSGYMGKDETIKTTCEKCGAVMIRRIVNRRRNDINIFAPRGEGYSY